jgi:hypothetical protein
MARQEAACWRCGTQWATEDGRPRTALRVIPGGAPPTLSGFAAHVHQVVDLDGQGASIAAVETHIDSMDLDMQEEAALCLLASSLHNAPGTRRVVNTPVVAVSHL